MTKLECMRLHLYLKIRDTLTSKIVLPSTEVVSIFTYSPSPPGVSQAQQRVNDHLDAHLASHCTYQLIFLLLQLMKSLLSPPSLHESSCAQPLVMLFSFCYVSYECPLSQMLQQMVIFCNVLLDSYTFGA